MLASIEKATRQKIEAMTLPSTEMVNSQRISRFKQTITDTLAGGSLEFMQGILESYEQEHDVSPIEIAAALAKLSMGEKSLLLEPEKKAPRERKGDSGKGDSGKGDSRKGETPLRREGKGKARPEKKLAEGMERFRIEIGHDHEVQPGNIVGAIANEAGLDAEHIGHIDIRDKFSFVELPEGMPKAVFNDLQKVWIGGQKLKISRLTVSDDGKTSSRKTPSDEKTSVKKSRKPATADKKRKKKSNSSDKEKKRKPRKKPSEGNDSAS
jgi:ATP-dependent RNA helicase DeaD